VNGISAREVADHAGVELAYVSTLVDRGVLRPAGDGTFTEGDARRARVYEGLERAGLPLDALIEALERGELSLSILDLPVYERIARVSTRTFREVSEREDIPVELLLVVREAIGFAQARPDDRMREDELAVVPIIRLQVMQGFDPAVIERWLRVYGDALRRIAETEADWWHTQISVPSLATGLTEAEMLASTNELGWEVASLTEQALIAIYHAHQEHTWTENLIEEIEAALDRAGLRERIAAPPAICFLDITDYTRLTEERGDHAAAELASRLTPLVQRPSERHGGKVVKWLGDGVMFHFREPGGGVRAALEMLDAIDAAGLPPAHVGLHVGPVVFQGGDYFGRTVNVAARIADHAGAGQLLVSREVVEAVGLDDVAFSDVGPVELKGVKHPVSLFAARHLE
jgi:adenylate cyclase